MNRSERGDIGEYVARLFYAVEGCVVSVPQTNQSRYDLIIDRGGALLRVQVKTSNFLKNGSYEVQLRTSGPNLTDRNKVKKLSAEETDVVFILLGDGSAYEFPIEVLAGRNSVSFGSSNKYEDYRVGTYANMVKDKGIYP